MNLIVDQGNSFAKMALFRGDELIRTTPAEQLNATAITRFISGEKIERVILSTVKRVQAETVQLLKSVSSHFLELDHTCRLPFRIDYRTPQTLGKDRIAAVAGAWFQSPGSDILVIDAGTAITFDFISAEAVYLGGNIAPGMTMRLKALNHFTDRLPLIDATGETPFTGYDTETAIRAGVAQGMTFEISGYIDKWKESKPNLLVFLTGGDTFYFDRMLKRAIFADEFLVLKGLNRILNYNAEY